MLMTFLMVKKNTTQLTFIAQAKIKHKKTKHKKKKEKGKLIKNKKKKRKLMTFTIKKKYPPAYLHNPSQIQVQKASLKKKKEKGTLMTFLMVKKNTTQLTFIAQVSRKHPLKKKKKKEH